VEKNMDRKETEKLKTIEREMEKQAQDGVLWRGTASGLCPPGIQGK